MKPEQRNPLLYLNDIKVSMERIQEYLLDIELADLQKDYKTTDAIIRNFEIIGEASRNLPENIKIKYPQIPWKQMYLLRNQISHGYFGIKYNIIWTIAKEHLPQNYLDILEVIKLEG